MSNHITESPSSPNNEDINGKPVYVASKSDPLGTEHVPVYGTRPLHRVGFVIHVPARHKDDPEYLHDPRPILWPVYHPFHVVHHGEDYITMMAYVVEPTDVHHLWPDATDLTVFDDSVTHYTFNGAFPKPDWLEEVQGLERIKRTGAYKITDNQSELSSIGFGDDIEYDLQLNFHQLLYGTHAHEELQAAYTGPENLEVTIYDTTSVRDAELKAKQLIIFENNNDDLPGGLV